MTKSPAQTSLISSRACFTVICSRLDINYQSVWVSFCVCLFPLAFGVSAVGIQQEAHTRDYFKMNGWISVDGRKECRIFQSNLELQDAGNSCLCVGMRRDGFTQ